MKNLTLIASVLFATALSAASGLAQTATPAPTAAMEKAPMKDATEGEVRKIDKEARKITLKHGPIKNLDMPGMTMVFQVKDVALLDKLVVGDKILFTAEQRQGAFVVTGIEKAATK